MNGSMRFPLHMRLAPQRMCLAPDDLISRRLIDHGRWYDCGKYIRLWGAFGPDGRATGGPPGVVLEVGANIGACTVEILLRTNARIVAFEPLAMNLFFLTRTLKLLVERNASLADRVLVFPVGVGETWSRSPIFVEPGNQGNAVMRRPFVTGCLGKADEREACIARRMQMGGHVAVVPLDGIFPRGLGSVGLLKIDTQGFECNVLRGARIALSRSHNLMAVVAEVATSWLNAQCCGRTMLYELLRTARPAWGVSCTKRVGSDSNCVGYRETPQLVPTIRLCRFILNRTKGLTVNKIRLAKRVAWTCLARHRALRNKQQLERKARSVLQGIAPYSSSDGARSSCAEWTSSRIGVFNDGRRCGSCCGAHGDVRSLMCRGSNAVGDFHNLSEAEMAAHCIADKVCIGFYSRRYRSSPSGFELRPVKAWKGAYFRSGQWVTHQRRACMERPLPDKQNRARGL